MENRRSRAVAGGIAAAGLGLTLLGLAPAANAQEITDPQVLSEQDLFRMCQGENLGHVADDVVARCDYTPTTPVESSLRWYALPEVSTDMCGAPAGTTGRLEVEGRFTRTRAWTVGGALGGGAQFPGLWDVTVNEDTLHQERRNTAPIAAHTFDVAPGWKARGVLVEAMDRSSGVLEAAVTYEEVTATGTPVRRVHHREIPLEDVEIPVSTAPIGVTAEKKECDWAWEDYQVLGPDRWVSTATSAG